MPNESETSTADATEYKIQESDVKAYNLSPAIVSYAQKLGEPSNGDTDLQLIRALYAYRVKHMSSFNEEQALTMVNNKSLEELKNLKGFEYLYEEFKRDGKRAELFNKAESNDSDDAWVVN